MHFQGGHVFGLRRLYVTADFQHGQRQDALRSLLQRTVECLVQLMLHHLPGADRSP